MTRDELEEIKDRILNPLTVIIFYSDNKAVKEKCEEIVEYIRGLEADDLPPQTEFGDPLKWYSKTCI